MAKRPRPPHRCWRFEGLENPLTATRYHSLVIDRQACPEVLEITAWVDDGTIMGVRHRQYPHVQGVQFHPKVFSRLQASSY